MLTALRPATSTIPGAKLIAISTPYSQSGSLYEAHRDHYGRDDEHTLVWQADTRTMNPTIDEGLIQREIERDPEGAHAEWLATFRTDLQAAFSPEALEACTVKGRYELPSSPFIEYRGFVDPSGGKSDAFTVAIGHEEDGKAIVDVAKAWPAPFDPSLVTGEIAELLKGYGVLNVTGDNYGGEWPVASFRERGIAYTRGEKSKSDLYISLVATTNSRGIELPDDKRLQNELRRLERRRGRSGKDSVDHPPRLRDDLANAVAGVCYLLSNAEKEKGRHEFNPQAHIAKQNLRIVPGNWPLFVGVSSDDNFAASVVGQSYNLEVRIFAAFLTEGMSLRHHFSEYTRPWLSANCPRLELMGGYEDDPRIEIRAKTHEAAVKILGGSWVSIWHKWENRLDQMRDMLVKAQPFTFKPAVQISQVNTTVLTQALQSGRYREKVLTDRKSYHVVNAFTLLLARQELWKATPKEPKSPRLAPSYMSS